MLKPCVEYKHMITSAKVQQSSSILMAFSHAVRTHHRVPRGAVRTHSSIEVTHYDSRSEDGTEETVHCSLS